MKRKSFRIKPVKVNIKRKTGENAVFEATRGEYKFIELKGEPIESFERVEKINEIILLGEHGGIRRLILK